MPWGDWQFWVVSAGALAGLVALFRAVRPRPRKKTRATLTIEGRDRER